MKGCFHTINEKLKLWLEQNEKTFTENGIIQIERYEYNNESLVVQHETNLYIGEITACIDGFTNIQVLEIKTGELVLCMHCMCREDMEISPMFDMYMNFIKRRI